MDVLRGYIPDGDTFWLIGRVVESFSSTSKGKGLPLGNLTSQLLVNVYMNEFDQFAKHTLKAKYYIRYADDFVFLSEDRTWLESLVPRVQEFLRKRLTLELHPKKVSIGTLAAGVDFLGWIHFFDHRVLRSVSRRRTFRAFKNIQSQHQITSYQGMMKHGNTFRVREALNLG